MMYYGSVAEGLACLLADDKTWAECVAALERGGEDGPDETAP